jgi:competence protein ComEC
MAAALAVGIAAAEWLRPHPALVLAALLPAALWAGFTRRHAAAALLLVAVLAGALCNAYAQTAGRGDLGAWQGQKVTVVATVTEEPELKSARNTGYAAQVETVNGHLATGKTYITQLGGTAPEFGERVEVSGTLKAPAGARTPGGFDEAAYLARQGIYLTLDTNGARRLGPGRINPIRRAAVAARTRLEGVLKATLPTRDAALMAGLLFGSRSDLPDDITTAFRMSGVFHLLAVSGGNLAMVAMPLLGLLRRTGLRKRWASAAVLPVVVFYVFLTGASPSVLRAGIMAGIVLTGDILRRERDAVNTLGATALLLLLADPTLLFDLGFQLSAVATLGILLFARPVEGWLAPRLQAVFGDRPGQWVASGLSVTLAAQCLVEPISLHAFGMLSTIAPVANLLVLVFLEPVTWVGGIAALAGLVSTPVAWVLNWPVRLGLWLLLFLVKATAAVPGAYLEVTPLPVFWMLVWYTAVMLLAAPSVRATLVQAWRAHGRQTKLAVAACLAAALSVGFTWRLALADPADTLRVTFLDVGQGDAILIEAPGGATMLVDAGVYVPPDPRSGRRGYDAGAEVVLPHLAGRGIRRLDYLVLTHPDSDHAGGGVSVLQGIAVGALLKSDEHPTEKRYLAALQTAVEQGIPMKDPVAGDRIRLGADVVLEVLNPPQVRFSGTRSDDNSNCLAFRLTYRQVAMILACDLEGEIEERLVTEGADLRADLLKAAHHGSGYSTTERFLQAVGPRYAVLSVGNGNRYGHPHAGTLERLRQVGVQVYRTDRHGSVVARTDGLTLSVSSERGGPQDDQYHPLGLLGRRWLFAW